MTNKADWTSHRLRSPGHGTGNLWGRRGAVSVPSRVHPISGCQEEKLSPAVSAFAMLAAGRGVGTGKEIVADERDIAGKHLLG